MPKIKLTEKQFELLKTMALRRPDQRCYARSGGDAAAYAALAKKSLAAYAPLPQCPGLPAWRITSRGHEALSKLTQKETK